MGPGFLAIGVHDGDWGDVVVVFVVEQEGAVDWGSGVEVVEQTYLEVDFLVALYEFVGGSVAGLLGDVDGVQTALLDGVVLVMEYLFLGAAAGDLHQALAIQVAFDLKGEAVLDGLFEERSSVLFVVLAEQVSLDKLDFFLGHLLKLVALVLLQLFLELLEKLQFFQDVHCQLLSHYYVQVLKQEIQLVALGFLYYFQLERLKHGLVQLQ